MAQDSSEQQVLLMKELRDAIGRRKCLLMVGYGLVSLVTTNEQFPQSPPSTCTQMLRELAKSCSINEKKAPGFYELLNNQKFSEVGAMIEKSEPKRLNRLAYLSQILLCDLIHLPIVEYPAHRLIASMPFRGYLTTTYDVFIETAYVHIHDGYKPFIGDYTDIKKIKAHEKNGTGLPFILKLHGDITPPHIPLLNDLDFRKRFSLEQKKVIESWQELFKNAPVLFIGFENDDPGLQCIEYFFEQGLFDTSTTPDSPVSHWIAVARDLPRDTMRIFRALTRKYKNLHLIFYDKNINDFLEQLEKPSPSETASGEEKTEVFIIQQTETGKDKSLINLINTHLASLEEEITIWSIQRRRAGEQKTAIEKHLDSAKIILLLFSPDFIKDTSCETLMQQAMNRYRSLPEGEKPKVIPLILRDCDWQYQLSEQLQPVPQDGTSLDGHKNKDQILAELCKEIRKERLKKRPPDRSAS